MNRNHRDPYAPVWLVGLYVWSAPIIYCALTTHLHSTGSVPDAVIYTVLFFAAVAVFALPTRS